MDPFGFQPNQRGGSTIEKPTYRTKQDRQGQPKIYEYQQLRNHHP